MLRKTSSNFADCLSCSNNQGLTKRHVLLVAVFFPWQDGPEVRVVYTDMRVEGREPGRGPGQALAGFFLTTLTAQACGQGTRRRGSQCSASGGAPEPLWAWRSGAICVVEPWERRSFLELASTCPGAPRPSIFCLLSFTKMEREQASVG